MPQRKVQIPVLRMEMPVIEGSARRDEKGHLLIDVVWSKGAPVVRHPWWDDPYIEELSLDPTHVNLSRLNNGAPVLDSHQYYELKKQLGRVASGTAKVDGKEGIATLKMSKREDIQGIVKDIEDYIITKISVGYKVIAFEEHAPSEEGKMRTLKAINWEPLEVSFVTIPADDGAESRSMEQDEAEQQTYECTIFSRALRSENMPPESTQTPASVPTPAPTPVNTEELLAKGRQEEREYQAQVRKIVSDARLDIGMAEKFIEERKSIEVVKDAVLERLANSSDSKPTVSTNHTVTIERDERDTRRESIESALLFRLGKTKELEKNARNYTGMSLIEIARETLGSEARGIDRRELATRALMVTSDLPYVLQNIANKSLRMGYDSAPRTFLPIARKTTHNDFKGVTRVMLEDVLSLEKLLEGGLIKHGSLADGGESYKLASYGKQISFTREMLINDDLDSFERIPRMFGRNASDLESDVFWKEFEGGKMSDDKVIWHADHSNLITDAAAISEATLDALEQKMANQKKANGQPMNILAKYLVVPRALRNKAKKLVAAVNPHSTADVNVYENVLEIISEVRLTNANNHYLVGDYNAIDTFEIAYLAGQEGVGIEQSIDFDTRGVKMSAVHDFATKCIDFRSMAKQIGA